MKRVGQSDGRINIELIVHLSLFDPTATGTGHWTMIGAAGADLTDGN